MTQVELKAVASYIPEGCLDAIEIGKRLGMDAAFIESKIGTRLLSRKGDQETTADLSCRAFEALAKSTDLNPGAIDCIVVCTQNPDHEGLPHVAGIVQERIGAPTHCAAFDISLGCSGFVYGSFVLQTLMEGTGYKNGVLITADPYSKIVSLEDRNTAVIFGDAATATHFSQDSPGNGYRLSNLRTTTRGDQAEALMKKDHQLFMNGRAIFDFVMKTVPPDIRNMLAEAKLSLKDVDLFVFHQGSRFVVDTLCQRLQIDENKVPLLLEDTGNTVSSSIPLILEKFLPQQPERLLLSGFGVGLSAATCLLTAVKSHGIRSAS